MTRVGRRQQECGSAQTPLRRFPLSRGLRWCGAKLQRQRLPSFATLRRRRKARCQAYGRRRKSRSLPPERKRPFRATGA
ncbi:hypothetical protein M8494_05440 [Serratia ureilytica]